VLYAHKEKIQAAKEYEIRTANSELNQERVHKLVLDLTGNRHYADKAAAVFALEDSKRNRQ